MIFASAELGVQHLGATDDGTNHRSNEKSSYLTHKLSLGLERASISITWCCNKSLYEEGNQIE